MSKQFGQGSIFDHSLVPAAVMRRSKKEDAHNDQDRTLDNERGDLAQNRSRLTLWENGKQSHKNCYGS